MFFYASSIELTIHDKIQDKIIAYDSCLEYIQQQAVASGPFEM